MNIYIIFEFVLIILFAISKRENRNVVFGISCCILILLTGFHDGNFYNDYPHYLKFYMGQSYGMYGSLDNPIFGDLEPFYCWYVRLLRLLGTNKFLYIFTTALVFASSLIFIMSKRKECAAFAIFFLLVYSRGETFLFYLAAHRQMLSIVLTLWAYCVFEYADISKIRKSVWCTILIVLSCLCHSSAYLVLPVIVLLRYSVIIEVSKKTQIITLLMSMIIGAYLFSVFREQLSLFAMMLEGEESVERSIYYLTEDVYEDKNYHLTEYLFYTIFCGLIVFYSNKSELQSFGVRALLFATVTRNLFGVFPLYGRYILIFYLIAFPLCCPKRIIYGNIGKLIMICFMSLYVYSTSKYYVTKDCRILPYTFIFE